MHTAPRHLYCSHNEHMVSPNTSTHMLKKLDYHWRWWPIRFVTLTREWRVLYTWGGAHTCTHRCVHTRVQHKRLEFSTKDPRDDSILCQRQAGWWIWWINHPLCLIRTSVTELDGGWWVRWEGGGQGERRRREGRAKLEALYGHI